MSDLAATNCGCNDVGNGSCNSLIWILILLSCCGNGNGLSNGFGGDNSCLWIILLLFCCGNGNGNGNDGFGCGC